MKKKNGKTQVASTKSGAESFKNMKEVERGKMRKTIQNIKGTPKEIAKDKMEDDLIKEIQNSKRFKKRASAKAANPKKLNKPEKPKKLNKTKSNVSPREYLVNRAKTNKAMRDDVNVNLNRDAKPVPKKKPKYRDDEGSPIGTVSKQSTTTYTPRKKYEGGIDSYETPFGTIKADSSDDAFNFDVEEKDGGYLKRDMMMKKRKKGGFLGKGAGKAQRGY